MIRGRRKLRSPILLTISADTSDYNLYTAAGSPTVAVDVVLTINSGVTVYGVSGAAINVGTGVQWFPGTTIRIVNNGTICGAGQAGANGSVGHAGAATTLDGSSVVGGGGDAISTGMSITIDNTAGNIFGGGGGGGGGAGDGEKLGAGGAGGGGGGGGGRGRNNPSGGSGGAGDDGGSSGSSGAAGSFSSPGLGGVAGTPFSGAFASGYGGNGGDWGQAGSSGNSSNSGSGGSGGAAGYAVHTSGFGNVVTFTGGNNPSQVKGIVA